MRLRRVLTGALVSLLLVAGSPGSAAAAPYDADPLGLVPFADTVQRVYSNGTDVWEVWVCRAPNHEQIVDLTTTVAALNAEITTYFQVISAGRYNPMFVTGGEVAVPGDLVAGGRETPFATACEAEVAAASTVSPDGAMILTDVPYDVGYSTQGTVCPEPPFGGCETVYPANLRTVVLGAATVTRVASFTAPQWITAAHELGHAIGWPHSFSGLTTDPDTGMASRYDNPMDLMSGGIHTGDPIGTIAYNRYSAGWVDPADVEIHRGPLAFYELSSDPGRGTQMVVLPTEEEGLFVTLGARHRPEGSYDAILPRSGVEAYVVDQRAETACSLPDGYPETWPCFSIFTRISQIPRAEGMDSVDHVLGIDDSLNVVGATVTVTEASGTTFKVRIALNDSGSFTDDDGNIHEPNIETIFALDITSGCGDRLYCPDQAVTRAQMAVFLVRAMALEPDLRPYDGAFSDVDPEAWYAPYVGMLESLGIVEGTPDGDYLPGAPVNRAQTAAFFVRAFDHLDETPLIAGFEDVSNGDWFSGYVQGLYDSGVTLGCSAEPLRYCPANPVRRDQMASLLARALGIGS